MGSSKRAARLGLFLAAAACAAGAAAAQTAFVAGPERALPLTSPGGTFDNVRGSWLLFETAPLAPLALVGERLLVLNAPGLELVVQDRASKARLFAVPAGPGLVSVAVRPGSDEVWLVDALTHTVGIVDLDQRAIVHTIAIQGREPHGIAFHPSGDRAWIACSASNTVEVVRTATRRTAAVIDVPALQPRALAFQDGKLWVAPLLSGNDTTVAGPLPTPNLVQFVIPVSAIPGLNPLPDRDLLGIVATSDPATDWLDPSLTIRGLGTSLLHAAARPGTSEVWVASTDALNAAIRGEENAVGGQFVRNRVSVVDVVTKQVTLVDLDLGALDGRHCAQPFAVTFDASGARAYVAGYGSDIVAVLDAEAPEQGWIGYYTIPGRIDPATQTAERSGPRGLLLDAERNELLVFDKGDGALSVVDLDTAPLAGGVAGTPLPLGFDPTTDALRRGRLHAVNAEHSLSGTTSCASCHVDGNLDGVVWELSRYLDPEGTPGPALAFPVDVKGPMVTQRLRGLRETAPYHWRGERGTLAAFNAGFTGLLDRPEPLPAADFADLEEYMLALVYPANPRQSRARDYAGDAALGFAVHTQVDTVQPAFPGATRCAVCHSHPLGSSGEVFRNNPSVTTPSTKVPQMRGLQDKLGEQYDVGFPVGDLRTEQGMGAMHSGARGTIFTYHASQELFLMTTQQIEWMVAFLGEFDTGLAPSTAWQRTITAKSAGRFLVDPLDGLPYVLAQLAAGHCDLVVHARLATPLPFDSSGAVVPGSTSAGAPTAGTLPPPAAATPLAGLTSGPHVGVLDELFQDGRPVALSFAYEHASGRLRLAHGDKTVAPAALVAWIAQHGGVATFLGLPLGMGWRFGVDRDFDGVLDGDEPQLGTDPLGRDSDGDGFEDGHELAHGMDPLVPNASSPDVEPPLLLGSSLVYATTNAAKVELLTSEVCRATLTYGAATVAGPPLGVLDVNHSLVLTPLPAGTTLDAELELVDGAGNTTSTTVTITTRPRVVPFVIRVADIELDSYDSGPHTATVSVTVSDQQGGTPAAESTVHAFAYYADAVAPLTVVSSSLAERTTGHVATFVIALPPPGSALGRTLHFGVTQVDNPGLSYVEAEDLTSFESFALVP